MTRPEQPIVVKLGGETLAEQHATLEGAADAARSRRLVIVHGGGKRLSGWLDRLGVQSRFEDGRRVTDDETLSVVVAVLRGLINAELVASLRRLGVAAVGLSGVDGDLIQAERVPALGRVGRVVGARTAILDELLGAGFVPVVAPIALDERVEICNVNADEVAAGLAAALGGRLVLLTDTDGVRGRDGNRIDRLDAVDAEALIAGGIILGGMIPKVRAAIAVIAAGGRDVLIADGRGAKGLARALDDPTSGTRMVAPASDGSG
ncbi:MAG TPA: acetylglutamate kinase [Candidatus Limnocylindria bacterium]|nr:acetylglutamate kinase [Candidatus Limnocylindria bacterium]